MEPRHEESAAAFEAGKARLLREARLLAKLDKQPEIVSVRDFFQANYTACMVMETVAGTLTIQGIQMYNYGSLTAGALHITGGGALFSRQALTLNQGGISLNSTSGLACLGPIALNGDGITVEEHSLVHLYEGELVQCGDIVLDEGARLTTTGAQVLDSTILRLRDGILTNLGGFTLNGVTTALEGTSVLVGASDLVLRRGSLFLEEDCFLHSVPTAALEWREDAIIYNQGICNLSGFEEQKLLDATFHNQGWLVLGSVYLQVAGLLDNQGHVALGPESEIRLDSDTMTGNPQEAWDETNNGMLWP